MKLNAIIELVDKYYPNAKHVVIGYWDSERQRVRVHHPNSLDDTLALFLVRELKDTYDADKDDKEQLAEAVRVVKRAEGELAAVRKALEEAQKKAQRKVIPFRRT